MLPDLANQLEKVAGVSKPVERSIRIAAVIARALESISQEAVLVGGAAVEFYTEGNYSTSDIDFVAPGGKELIRVMEKLGFKKNGKDFIHDALKIYVEFPGAVLKPGERIQKIKIGDQLLSIISPEDLIVDRLCSFKFWQSGIDGLNAILLLENQSVDWEHLNNRANIEEVADALRDVQQVREEVIRKKLNPEQATDLLTKYMKQLR